MTDPAAAWHEEHRYFQKLLTLLLQRVRLLADGGEPDCELMLDIASYLHDYADEMHHPRADIEMAAATYLIYYGNHVAREEQEVLAKAAAVLTKEDWASVRHGVPSRPDPVFGATPEQRYRELRRRIALEA